MGTLYILGPGPILALPYLIPAWPPIYWPRTPLYWPCPQNGSKNGSKNGSNFGKKVLFHGKLLKYHNLATFQLFFKILARFDPKTAYFQAKTSTIRSGEDPLQPGSTLSSRIEGFHPFWPVFLRLAMNTRLNGLSIVLDMAPSRKVVA